MVGREFVPNEDMGEWTIHVDAPEGTSLEGTTEVAFKLLKELKRHRRGGAASSRRRRLRRPRARRRTSISSVRRCRSTTARIRRRKSSPRCGAGLRSIQATGRRISSRNALGSGEGNNWFPISVQHPRAGSRPDRRLLQAGARGRAEAAQHDRGRRFNLNVSNPEVHVAVDRKRAADLGVRMSTIGNTLRLAVSGDDRDLVLQGKARNSTRLRFVLARYQRRDIEEIGRLTVPSKTGPVRIDNIARLERGPEPNALQRLDCQFTVQLIGDIAPGHALDEMSNDVRRMLAGLNMPLTMSLQLVWTSSAAC